ncbi:hypothetical protein OG218_09345 [Kineococcus sp. NBC_00420]|uniref:hypothetical protein n=1 Tax=Kineococcus sp. NBC_00420 TaxID=2903564 RepID=UPI002E250CEA
MISAPTEFLPPTRATWRGWAAVRAALLVLTAVTVLGALLLGVRESTVADLEGAVLAGRVSSVQVSGGLPPEATSGEATQQVSWREGRQRHRTENRQVLGGTSTAPDVRVLVASWDRSVPVETVPWGSGPTWDVLGLGVPTWVGVLTLVQGFGGLVVLVNAAPPWRATRWAWFWLFSLPFGVTAFLLLSGPLPGRPTERTSSRRLRGGWAFVLSMVVLGGVQGSF